MRDKEQLEQALCLKGKITEKHYEEIVQYINDNFISKEKIIEKINNLQKPNYDNPKAIRVAKAVGKNQTNNGVVAQARIDGFDVAIKEVIELLTKQEEV